MTNFQDMDAELQREIARQGGVASGKARRKSRTLREAAKAILAAKAPSEAQEKVREILNELPQDEAVTVAEALAAIAIDKVIKDGDMNAADKLFRWSGEDILKVDASANAQLTFQILTADPDALRAALEK